MNRPTRREFLLQSGALALSVAALPGCHAPPTRAQVLADLVRDVAVPDLKSIVFYSAALESHVQQLQREPSSLTLRNTQDAWKRALVAWKRAYAFREGPLVETSALLRALFWPARTQAIEDLLRGQQPIDDVSIDALGVDVRGLFGMEVLLFAPDALDAPLMRLSSTVNTRPRDLLAAYARNVSHYARAAHAAIGPGEAFAAAFSGAGQESLNRLVNQMVATVESVGLERLQLVIDHAGAGFLRVSDVEGGLSGSSHVLLQTVLGASQRLYLGVEGKGLTALVAPASQAIDAKLRAAFTKAVSATQAIHAPLERVVKTQPFLLEAAAGAVKELEVSLKSELASGLGVTLTFTAGDGD